MKPSGVSSHSGDIFGSDGSLIGRKDMSDKEFLAPLLSDDACPHGAYRFGEGRSADGGLTLVCIVCKKVVS